jgi:hypothetical protein
MPLLKFFLSISPQSVVYILKSFQNSYMNQIAFTPEIRGYVKTDIFLINISLF